MQRIVVVGNSGSGKSTLAGQLADKLELTHIELDSLFHQPGWTPRDPEDFRSDLAARMDDARAGWTICGNYTSVTSSLTTPQADTVVWLDLSRSLVMQRVMKRTIRRAVTREELWNGNREPLTNFYRWDPEKNIVRWAWTRHEQYRDRYSTAIEDGTWAHASVHQLRSPEAVSKFLGEAS